MASELDQSALVDLAYAVLKDATNRCFCWIKYADSWLAVTVYLGESLANGTLIEATVAAATAGSAKAQFVLARLMRAKRTGAFREIDVDINFPTTPGGLRPEMHRLLKAAAKQGLPPALRE